MCASRNSGLFCVLADMQIKYARIKHKRNTKNRVYDVRAHGIVRSFFSLSRTIKIVSYRIITSVHIKRKETIAHEMRSWPTFRCFLSLSLSISGQPSQSLYLFPLALSVSSDVKVSIEKRTKRSDLQQDLESVAPWFLRCKFWTRNLRFLLSTVHHRCHLLVILLLLALCRNEKYLSRSIRTKGKRIKLHLLLLRGIFNLCDYIFF